MVFFFLLAFVSLFRFVGRKQDRLFDVVKQGALIVLVKAKERVFFEIVGTRGAINEQCLPRDNRPTCLRYLPVVNRPTTSCISTHRRGRL